VEYQIAPRLFIETGRGPSRGFEKCQDSAPFDLPLFEDSGAPSPPHQLVDRAIGLGRFLGIERRRIIRPGSKLSRIESNVGEVAEHMLDVVIEHEAKGQRL